MQTMKTWTQTQNWDSESDAADEEDVESEQASSDKSDTHRQPYQRGIMQTDVTFRQKKESITPKVFHFNDDPGLNADVLSMQPEETTSLDYFSIFVHDDLLDIPVSETNIFAKQHTDTTDLKPDSRLKQWKLTTHSAISTV